MVRHFLILLMSIVIALSTSLGSSAAGAWAGASASPAQQRLVYQTNWKHGLAGWDIVAGPWNVTGGQLITDPDMYQDAEILAPKGTHNLSRYEVQARVLVADISGNNASFGLILRSSGDCSGIDVGYQYWYDWGNMDPSLRVWPGCGTGNAIATQDFSIGNGWHTLQANVRGSTISVYVDGQYRMRVTTNTAIFNSRVGIASYGVGIDVKVFKMFAT